MQKLKVGLLLAALLLGGCGAQTTAPASTATPPAAGQSVWQIVETPTPTRDDQGVLRSPIDNMPLLAMGNSEPYRDDQGILRSPIDNMPLIPGDPKAAPMPGMPQK